MMETESPFRVVAAQVLFDEHPGIDGCSNAERAVYFCNVMDVETIDLNEKIDLTMLVKETDLPVVDAAVHYLMLQLAYFRRLLDTGFISPEEYQPKCDSIALSLRRVKWHKQHLSQGIPTPPFSITD